jgi:hypothetical protein
VVYGGWRLLLVVGAWVVDVVGAVVDGVGTELVGVGGAVVDVDGGTVVPVGARAVPGTNVSLVAGAAGGFSNSHDGKSRVASAMNLRQIVAGNVPPVTSMPWTLRM